LLKNALLNKCLISVNTELRKLAATLALMAILLSSVSMTMKPVFSSGANGNVDVFTQKQPYNGKGPNAPSDAFGPGEEVQIYALVTYNEYPVPFLLVAFTILKSESALENITIYRTAPTNETGIATVNLRISHLNQTAFGEWAAIASAKIGDATYEDSTTFNVGYIVEIVSLRTVDESHTPQDEFARGGTLGVELILRNIAMTEKAATLTVAIYDSSNAPGNSTRLSDFAVQPNGTLVNVCFSLYIPRNTNLGTATVYACAYETPTESTLIPYCPEASEHFSVIIAEYFLKIKTEPAGIAAIPGEGWYEKGAYVYLVAPDSVIVSHDARYVLGFWDIDSTSQGRGVNSTVVLMLANHTATAHYTQALTYTLTIIGTNGGTTNPAPGTYNYNASTVIHVAAVPRANYLFDHWELDNTDAGSANPYSVLVDRDHTLKAVFSPVFAGWFVPDWFLWFLLLLLLILVTILLLIWRLRGKRAEGEFYSGWTAWYYGYDLRNKRHRTQRI